MPAPRRRLLLRSRRSSAYFIVLADHADEILRVHVLGLTPRRQQFLNSVLGTLMRAASRNTATEHSPGAWHRRQRSRILLHDSRHKQGNVDQYFRARCRWLLSNLLWSPHTAYTRTIVEIGKRTWGFRRVCANIFRMFTDPFLEWKFQLYNIGDTPCSCHARGTFARNNLTCA